MARSAFLWFFTESWGSKQGIRRSPKSCTRKEHESATNPIAKRGQGAIAPCRVKGQRPLWGLGQRPNCSSCDQFQGSRQQRCRQRSVPASNFARPQTRPPSCSFQRLCCVAQMARPNCLSFRHGCLFPQAGISRLRARVGGFAVAPDTPSQRSPMRLDFYRNISLRICRCNHALPQWICGCLKKGAGKAKWN